MFEEAVSPYEIARKLTHEFRMPFHIRNALTALMKLGYKNQQTDTNNATLPTWIYIPEITTEDFYLFISQNQHNAHDLLSTYVHM